MALCKSRDQQDLEKAWLAGFSQEKLCASHDPWTKIGPKQAGLDWHIDPPQHCCQDVSPNDVRLSTKYVFLELDEPSLRGLRCHVGSMENALQASEKESLLQEFGNEFKQAETILDLEEDWDGEGSQAYKKETLIRAIDFVTNHVESMYDSFGIAIDIPDIGPGPDGTIDVHWCTANYELLVSIPSIHTEPASYYGDDYDGSVIRGSFDPSRVNMGFLQLWRP